MLDFFEDIANFISSIGDFIIGFFTNVINIVTLVFKGAVLGNMVIMYLPIQYQVVIAAFLAYVIIVTIIHFGG